MMIEERIKGGICQAKHRYAKANNKYMFNQNKNKESSFLQYLDVNNQYGWSMFQKLPVDGFRWIEKDDLLKFENFIKNYDKVVTQDILLRQMQNIQKAFISYTMIYRSYLKE